MNEALQQVINRNDTWQGHLAGQVLSANGDSHWDEDRLSTGYSTLDKELRSDGWPLGSTVEVLSDGCGLGSMGLFLPAMEKLSAEGRWQVFIAPPFTPYAPLLKARGIDTEQILLVHPKSREDLLWATEQALRSTTSSAVFSWLGADEYSYSELRKLQLAASILHLQDEIHILGNHPVQRLIIVHNESIFSLPKKQQITSRCLCRDSYLFATFDHPGILNVNRNGRKGIFNRNGIRCLTTLIDDRHNQLIDILALGKLQC